MRRAHAREAHEVQDSDLRLSDECPRVRKARGTSLRRAGYECTENSEEADVLVFNNLLHTRHGGEAGAREYRGHKALKRRNPSLIVAVCGCMPQQEGAAERIAAHYPYIDIILGTRNISRLPAEIERVLAARAAQKRKGRRTAATDMPEDYLSADEATPTLRTSYPNAWVTSSTAATISAPIAFVPYVRGREISRSEDAVLDEVKRAVDEGYGEITLLGQNVNSYGHDLGGGENFARAASEDRPHPGKFRVRFMTSHPKDLTREVAEAMAESDKICRALHLPVQSGSDRVLRDMTQAVYARKVSFRDRDAALSSCRTSGSPRISWWASRPRPKRTFRTPCPSFARSDISTRSHSSTRRGKALPPPPCHSFPTKIKKRRIGELIALQNSVTKELSERFVGGCYEVLAEDIADGPSGKKRHDLRQDGRRQAGQLQGQPRGHRKVFQGPDNFVAVGVAVRRSGGKVMIDTSKLSPMMKEVYGDKSAISRLFSSFSGSATLRNVLRGRRKGVAHTRSRAHRQGLRA